jgi:hypothetical protein
MFAFLASLIFVAAGEVAPPPPPPVPDAEVARYLKANELVEWNSAMRAHSAGESRVRQGQSIQTTSGGAAASTNGPKIGGLSETPEQVKARSQKIIDEGNAQIQQALPSLTRLRGVAAARAAEKTKPVVFALESAPAALNVAVTQSVVRLQKQARDAGFAKTHLIGGFALLGDGKLSRPAELSAEIRAAWNKADDKSLAAAPAEGYAYVPGADKSPASISPGLKPADAAKQLAVLWAEYYALAPDSTRGLLFLRLADAHTMRVIASEVAYTDLGATTAPAGVCSVALADDRSFLPRLSVSGEWTLGFERGSNPLGSALLAHLTVTQTKVGIAAAPYVVIVAGGGPAGAEGVGAKWRAVSAPAPAGVLAAFQVAGIPVGGALVEVGQLTVKVAVPAAAK